MHFLILTGMSGAGKTVAIRYLEDLGALCVDNPSADDAGALYGSVPERAPEKPHDRHRC